MFLNIVAPQDREARKARIEAYRKGLNDDVLDTKVRNLESKFTASLLKSNLTRFQRKCCYLLLVRDLKQKYIKVCCKTVSDKGRRRQKIVHRGVDDSVALHESE